MVEKKSLEKLEEAPAKITLHYAYQIPKEAEDVIKAHDQIKEKAKKILNKEATKIIVETGIETEAKLSLGLFKSTLKRLLATRKYNCIISPKLDSRFIKEFPETNFFDIEKLQEN